MSEFGNVPYGVEHKGFFSKLINGDFGLAKTYWLYGVVVGIVINIAVNILPSLGVLVLVLAATTVYQAVVLIGIWRAANRYQGRTLWAVLAKVATVLGWLGLLANIGILFEAIGYL